MSIETSDATILGAAPGDGAGGTLASLGDIDGDGYEDLAVGAGQEDSGGAAAGAVYIVSGKSLLDDYDELNIDAVATAIILGEASDDTLGSALGGGQDFDGDGTPDVLMGAAYNGIEDEGAAYVFYGSDALTGTLDAGSADAVLVGGGANDRIAAELGFAGDISGDGVQAIVVGVDNSDLSGETDAGGVFLVFDLGL